MNYPKDRVQLIWFIGQSRSYHLSGSKRSLVLILVGVALLLGYTIIATVLLLSQSRQIHTLAGKNVELRRDLFNSLVQETELLTLAYAQPEPAKLDVSEITPEVASGPGPVLATAAVSKAAPPPESKVPSVAVPSKPQISSQQEPGSTAISNPPLPSNDQVEIQNVRWEMGRGDDHRLEMELHNLQKGRRQAGTLWFVIYYRDNAGAKQALHFPKNLRVQDDLVVRNPRQGIRFHLNNFSIKSFTVKKPAGATEFLRAEIGVHGLNGKLLARAGYDLLKTGAVAAPQTH